MLGHKSPDMRRMLAGALLVDVSFRVGCLAQTAEMLFHTSFPQPAIADTMHKDHSLAIRAQRSVATDTMTKMMSWQLILFRLATLASDSVVGILHLSLSLPAR